MSMELSRALAARRVVVVVGGGSAAPYQVCAKEPFLDLYESTFHRSMQMHRAEGGGSCRGRGVGCALPGTSSFSKQG